MNTTKLTALLLSVLITATVFVSCAKQKPQVTSTTPEHEAEDPVTFEANSGPDTLNQEQKSKIIDDLIIRYPGAEKAFENGSLKHYGNYNGYVTLLYYGMMGVQVVTNMFVGKEIFTYNRAFRLMAYKDGVFYDVSDVYGKGISDEDVSSMLSYHETLYPQYRRVNAVIPEGTPAGKLTGELFDALKEAYDILHSTIRADEIYYYGTYGEASILLVSHGVGNEWTNKYGSANSSSDRIPFTFKCEFKLAVYCRGRLLDVGLALRNGLINDDNILTAQGYHNSIN